ncbi:DUF6602 domain-containing protein [Polaribacter sargassicola]|uniref:DUF6602 domain-containing protein n=1 Tax=Polaribacter sargassicola TaxID=2836891 RepID=UPI001F1BC85F|nr:DUF6602 domain-containing protein [Polaribacter sp. DS7-9]MCG1037020.1 hypothetical protein [Polaribacter sp. DS7-9]
MANRIFKNLLNAEIENFKSSFSNTSHELFYDNEKKKLIHPGEFGTYRERTLLPFLKMIMPQRLTINTGFLITPKDNISSQCDLVIYDSKSTPLIKDNQNQTFFPIETVVGVGEVKSNLSKTEFKKALNKLARNKKLRNDISENNPSFIKRDMNLIGSIDLKRNIYDNIFSFLICEKLNFDLSEINFDKVYDDDIEQEYKHNLILSVKDGIFLYKKDKMWGFPHLAHRALKDHFLKPEEQSPNEHFYAFTNFFFLAMESGTIFYPEIAYYLH